MEEMPERSGGRSDNDSRLQVVSRVFAVLKQFAPATPTLTLDELSNRLHLNKPSLLRILRSLEYEGMVHRSGDGYSLGAGIMGLANAFLESLSIHQVAQPYIEGLALECGQTATLAVLDGRHVIYLLVEHPQRDIGIIGSVGQRYPAHATAVGKVLLAFVEADALSRALDSVVLERLTHRTIVEPGALRRSLEKIRHAGFAVDDEERGIGIRCVAVPIVDRHGNCAASLSLSGPIFHLTWDSVPQYAQRLLETSRQISARLGYVAPAVESLRVDIARQLAK